MYLCFGVAPRTHIQQVLEGLACRFDIGLEPLYETKACFLRDALTLVMRPGNPTAIVSPYGQRTALQTDANGCLSCITNPADESLQLAYASDGLLTSLTDPRGNLYQYTYDADGRLTREDDPAGSRFSAGLAPATDLRHPDADRGGTR